MVRSGVYMTDSDGNITNNTGVSNEKVSGLLFDISKQSTIWTSTIGIKLKDALNGTIVELNSMDDVTKLGLTAYSGETDKDFMFGIPYYHIKHFFSLAGGTGRLFIMFADCSADWNAIAQMQRAAHGMISQLGVYTEQNLWKQTDDKATVYSVQLVADLNAKAVELSNANAPLSILLCAQSAAVATGTVDKTTVSLSMIPTCVVEAPKVTVLLGQGLDTNVTAMQLANTNHTPVGTVGAALGCLASASVQQSLAWVSKFNLVGYFPDIEFGFGNIAVDGTTNALTSTLKYSTLSEAQLNDLDSKGYVFLVKYAGLESGVYFNRDQTCSDGDYRTIARNRTINKSRRAVRNALLPYVNSPIKVDPTTGYLSSAQNTVFSNLVKNVLAQMATDEEISGYSVTISATQNVLTNDVLYISYKLVPVGTASEIDVTEGLALTNK